MLAWTHLTPTCSVFFEVTSQFWLNYLKSLFFYVFFFHFSGAQIRFVSKITKILEKKSKFWWISQIKSSFVQSNFDWSLIFWIKLCQISQILNLLNSAEVKTRILAPAFHARVPLETETDDLFARTGGGTGGTGGPIAGNPHWDGRCRAGFKKHRLVL